MKRYLLTVVLILTVVLMLAGCGCEHEWADADCVNPKTCSLCQETEGAPLGHTWAAATCTAPKTCDVCKATEGEAKGHTWEDATCILPKKCSICHETEGAALGHTWEEATTEAPKTCTACQLTEGDKIHTDRRFTTPSTKHLHGKWYTEVKIPGYMMGTEGYIDELAMTLYYEFGKAGELISTFELADELAFKDDMKAMIEEQLYDSLTTQGLSKSQADEAMVATYGMTVKQYADATVEEINMNEFFGIFNLQEVYYVEDGKIYSGLSWTGEMEPSAYKLENDVLIIDAVKLEEDGEPLQWKRVEEN